MILLSSRMDAATTGTILGRVQDAKTGEALVGVNVHVLGTVRGSSTDMQGRFEIPNMPPGQYEIEASMISYKPVILKSVGVLPDKTTTVEFQLEEKPIELNPIVVLGGKIEQRQDEAPVSLSVIDRREIEQRNPTNLVEALETAAGVNFIGDQINIRGSTGYTFGAGNKVLLLLDGVPVYQSDTGQFNWDMLPPLDIEQIEILKGAGSTLWGASALGGVVNVITKAPSPEGKIMFSTSYGQYDDPYYSEWKWTDKRLNYIRTDISLSKQFGKFGIRTSLGQFNSTGYQQVGDFNKTNVTTRLDYRFPNSIHLTTYAAYSYIRKGFFIQWKGPNDPYEVDESNLDNYANTNQLNLYAKLALPISPHFGMNIRASMVRSLMGNQFGKDSDFNPALGQGLEIQTDWLPHPDHTITSGIQYQVDVGSTEFTGDHKGFFIGPYIQNEWRARNNLRLTTGFRYDRYQLVGGLKEDLFSPRFGINWKPWERTALRASVGSGFRAATIVERFLELSIMNFKIIPNPGIKAESSWAYDVGFRQQITDNWNLDVSLFDNEYQNMIEGHLDLIRGQIQFRNIADARIRGIEATSKMKHTVFFAGKRWTPGLNATMTYLDHENKKYHEPLPYRPKLIATIRVSLAVSAFECEADYRYGSRIDAVKIYPINKRVPMKFVDMRFSWTFKNLKAQVGVQNLLNYNYAPMESNLMPMRTWTAGLKGEF